MMYNLRFVSRAMEHRKGCLVALYAACAIFSYGVCVQGATAQRDQNLNDIADRVPPVRVNKCCEKNEIMIDSRCTHVNETNSTAWSPVFSNENGQDNIQVKDFNFVIGLPDCESTQMWNVYHMGDSQDKLVLLADGKLRHFIHHDRHVETVEAGKRSRGGSGKFGRLNDPPPTPPEQEDEPHYYDYDQGKYCMEKTILSRINTTAQYALVCAPEMLFMWSNTGYLVRQVLDPILHVAGMVCLLITAVIYFILPTLRDLTGNIVTTVCVCLIVSQAADCVKTFTQFSSHISFMVADVIHYVSLLAAFFWLNSMGYYIWKTFKSRNVFLRVTDGRKYCYYSCYAWGCTLVLGALAVFAHLFLDVAQSRGRRKAASSLVYVDQETIGWLGIAVFFTPVAFTIIINIFFYVTTLKVINRMNTYGRIHHKLKHNFDMFLLMFLIMTIAWLFLLLSWLQYDGLVFAYVAVNALQGPLIMYVCVARQKHVTFLLRKSCCYSEPVPTGDWGDEMTQMNGSSY